MLTPWLVFFCSKGGVSAKPEIKVFQEVEKVASEDLFFWRLKDRPKNQRLFTLQKKEGFEEKSLGSTVFTSFVLRSPHDSARNFLKTLCLLQLLEFLQVKLNIFCMVFLRLSHRQCCFIQPQCDNAVHTNIPRKKTMPITISGKSKHVICKGSPCSGVAQGKCHLKKNWLYFDTVYVKKQTNQTKNKTSDWFSGIFRNPKKPSISESSSCEFCLPFELMQIYRWTFWWLRHAFQIHSDEAHLRQHQIQTLVFKGPL